MAVILKNIWVLWTCDNKAEVHWVLAYGAIGVLVEGGSYCICAIRWASSSTWPNHRKLEDQIGKFVFQLGRVNLSFVI